MKYLIEIFIDGTVDIRDCKNDKEVKTKLQEILENYTNIQKIEIYNMKKDFLSIVIEKYGYVITSDDLEETKKYLLEYREKGGTLN